MELWTCAAGELPTSAQAYLVSRLAAKARDSWCVTLDSDNY